MISLSWTLSRPLLLAILEDRLSDHCVAALVWERLGYLAPSAGTSLPDQGAMPPLVG